MKLNIFEYFQSEPPIVIRERYSLVKRLSINGLVQTFLAQDLHAPGHPDCIVQQLQVPAEYATQLPAVRQLFQTEAKGFSRLEPHDCIPPLLAHFEENGEFYIVREKVEGHTLAEELASPVPWPDQKVVALLNDLLSTLDYLHQNRIVHLNLQPSNLIRRREDARLVMSNFGAFQQTSARIITPGPGIGTPPLFHTSPYMPDEQIAGHPDPSSDIYAVGLIAIQALTGRSPEAIPAHPQTRELYWHSLASLRHPALLALLDYLVRYNARTRCQTAFEALAALSALPPQITWFAPASEDFISEVPTQELISAAAGSAAPTGAQQTVVASTAIAVNRTAESKTRTKLIAAPTAVRETIQKRQLTQKPAFRKIALPVGSGILALIGISALLVWRLPNSAFVREGDDSVSAGAESLEQATRSTEAFSLEKRETTAEVSKIETARASDSRTAVAIANAPAIEDVAASYMQSSKNIAIADTESAVSLAPEEAASTINRFYDFVAIRSWESARSLLSDDMAARLEPDFFYQFEDVSVENVRIVNQTADAADLLIQNTYVYLDGSFQQEERNYTVQMVNNQPKIVDTAFVEVVRGRSYTE